MKPILFSRATCTLLCAVATSSVAFLHAQAPKSDGAGNTPPLEQRLGELREKLKLTEDQVVKAREILKESGPHLRELRDDKSLSEDQRREKFREVMKANFEKISALLSPEQKKEFLEMRGPRPEAGGAPDGPPFLRLKALKERLKLTDAQSEKLEPALKAALEKLRTFRDESDPAQRRQKAQATFAALRDTILAELTEEQKQQFREWMTQIRPPGNPPK